MSIPTIDEPRKQIDLAEVRDCFSIVELLTYEDLSPCGPGAVAAVIVLGKEAGT